MTLSVTDRARAIFTVYVQGVRSGSAQDRSLVLAAAPPDTRDELARMIEDFHALSESRNRRSGAFQAGDQVEDFRLIREIGHGGMGVVWEAEQISLRRPVALKLLYPQFQFSHSALSRFQREAQAGGRLTHRGIVQVYGVGEFEGTPFIAQELIAGGRTLADLLAARREAVDLPAGYYREVAGCFVQIAEALQSVHMAGIIHRDVKPGNILLTLGGEPKVADFGLAKAADDATLSVTGDVLGTWFYMSPEQAMAKRIEIDHRTDVFSLGATLYEALTLVRAFLGDTSQQILQNILLEEPKDPRIVRSRTPRDLAVICMKCLEKKPGRRYSSMKELAEELGRFLRNEPILAQPPSAWQRTWKWCRRHPVLSVSGAVGTAALVVISGLAILLALEQGKTESALAAELKRANELKQVADFQAEQLSAIDVQAMGLGLRQGLFAKTWAAGELVRRAPAVLEEERAQLEGLVAGADFTGLALQALDQNVLEGALRAVEKFDDQPLVKAQLLQALADVLRELGLPAQAAAPQEEALAIRRRELGGDDPSTLISLSKLGALLEAQGKLADAELHYLESLEGCRRILGNGHRDTLNVINSLGTLLQRQSRLEEAEAYCKEALGGYRMALGNEDRATLNSINTMGSLLDSQGDHPAAEALFREALETSLRVLGDDDPATLIAINNLGYVLANQWELEEAESLFLQALEGGRRVLGGDHPDTLVSMNNVGFLLKAQGKYQEAEPYYREAMEGNRRVLGGNHPNTLTSIDNMGMLFLEQEEPKQAEPFIFEALAGFRRVLGDDAKETLEALNNMGNLLKATNRLEEARLHFIEALERARRTLDADDPFTLTLINNLGTVLVEQGRFAEAEPYFREALDGCRRRQGDENKETLISISNMGSVLQSLRKLEEAELLYREVLDLSRRNLDKDDPFTLVALNNLGFLLQEMQRLEEAMVYYQEALDGSRRVLGEDDYDTFISINNMGSLLESQEKLEEAEPYYQEALAGFRRKMGDGHTRTLVTLQNLTRLLHRQGRDADALALAQELVALTPEDSPLLRARQDLHEAIRQQSSPKSPGGGSTNE